MTPKEAAEKYHWIKYDPSTNTIDLFMDHHMLSTLRTCESYFALAHLVNVRPRGHKAWNLVHGAYLHSAFEHFYNALKLGWDKGKPINPDGSEFTLMQFLELGKQLWKAYRLDDYKDDKKYQEIGGIEGSLAMLLMYYAHYMDLRVRVVGTEIPFGFKKEVPIGTFHLNDSNNYGEGQGIYTVNCYLTGRMDLVVDNGHKIGPVDHKHTHQFRGDEWTKFNPHDGITGYIYALHSLINTLYPKYAEQGRSSLSGWIYHISAVMPPLKDRKGKMKTEHPVRFKATPIDKDPDQIEEFKERQLTTFKRVAALLFQDEEPQWNTNQCHFMFGRICEYNAIHETVPSQRYYIIQQHYQIAPAWNPAKTDEDNILERDKIMEAQAQEAAKKENVESSEQS